MHGGTGGIVIVIVLVTCDENSVGTSVPGLSASAVSLFRSLDANQWVVAALCFGITTYLGIRIFKIQTVPCAVMEATFARAI